MNNNLCKENKENGIKNISKYLFLFLKTLRKLNKYYPTKKYLYRYIKTPVDIEYNIINKKNKIPFSKGKIKTFWGFTSVTSQIRKTLDIDGEIINFNKGTIFALYGNIWGYDISLFNDKMNEQILLEPEQNGLVIDVVPPTKNNEIINIRIKIEKCNNILEKALKVFEVKSDFGYEITSDNKFIIKYKFDSLALINKKIRIFGEKFVKNNRTICKYIYNNKEYNLEEFFNIYKNMENKLEIELKGIENVSNINDMFNDCIYLSSLPDISKLNITKITDLSCMFKNCQSLSYLPDISKWDTSNVNDMSYMFYGCSFLKKLPDLSKWNIKEVTNIDSMFYSCESLLLLPDISQWNTSKISNMNDLFAGCSNLIYLPDISEWDHEC